MKVTIATRYGDVHADAVAWAVRQHGVAAETLVLGRGVYEPGFVTFDSRTKRNFRGAGTGSDLIWFRKLSLPFVSNGLDCSSGLLDQANIEESCTGYLDDFECMLAETHTVLNAPSDVKKASRKMTHMAAARRIGLLVPETVVTASRAEALSFAEDVGYPLIYKPYRHNLWKIDDRRYSIAHTRLVQAGELESIGTDNNLPGIFQKFIPKAAEYRLTVIGDELYVMRQSRDGQEHTADWRMPIGKGTRYSKARIPVDLSNRIFELVRHFNLDIATLDVAQDDAGNYYFLDLNPNGQFLYCEEHVPDIKLLFGVTQYIFGKIGENLPKHVCDDVSMVNFIASYRGRQRMIEQPALDIVNRIARKSYIIG